MRPLSPAHLRIEGRRITWLRRTRVQGDGWDGPDVPLGEGLEAYLLRLTRDGTLLHEVSLTARNWTVPQDVWDTARAGGDFAVEVAQLSETYGPGFFAERMIHV
ncbi:MAG: hypothetical protein Q4G24_08770 [Paracoccus sp. (in: a-proteobacteria)]|uniref:hypothetical protein n=1 Tax=Paracoccus sp. TaxID=267 RepID=UPI0026E06E4D|nr:hypothetical protein [Paracoccus sp. (in: a-proteobacteria)]MDO5621546.1 hypothetical protein [Paracoccus sp. (in: a-proteobacteria)]